MVSGKDKPQVDGHAVRQPKAHHCYGSCGRESHHALQQRQPQDKCKTAHTPDCIAAANPVKPLSHTCQALTS